MDTRQETQYQQDLIESLKNPGEAAAYFEAAMEEKDKEIILLALRNLLRAYQGAGFRHGNISLNI
ncbi:hypothetical protein [Desulfonatronospira sp.]|uniref:hypothetical protein n=1 Tax=Desulfonatronospira sp. TaxID=1962951 RepID=UPI0025BD7F0B|nr:hypothetical protein [Desulfonatronospira sp.]